MEESIGLLWGLADERVDFDATARAAGQASMDASIMHPTRQDRQLQPYADPARGKQDVTSKVWNFAATHVCLNTSFAYPTLLLHQCTKKPNSLALHSPSQSLHPKQAPIDAVLNDTPQAPRLFTAAGP